jgi:D-alanyl-D-alanine carboxypeptidase
MTRSTAVTSRPQHARGRVAGAHRRHQGAPRVAARAGQTASTVLVGVLAVGLAFQGAPADEPHQSAAAAATTAPLVAEAPAAGADDRPAPSATLGPVPQPTGVVDAARDRLVGPAPSLVVPSAPPVPLTPPAAAGLDVTQQSTSDPASAWVVVNKALPLAPADYAPADLVVVAGYEVRAALQDPLGRMLAAAAAEGVRLELRSGFRSYAYQGGVHADWAARIGQPRADEVSARPGHSEHQTGLAVDVGSATRPECDFQACFDQTPEGQWVAARAAEFGFLVRYTAANQAVTGYAPEGWHLRYVGTDLLAEMQRRGVTTLEELFGLPGGPAYP